MPTSIGKFSEGILFSHEIKCISDFLFRDFETIISQSDSSSVCVTNRIESRRRFHSFPSACIPSQCLPAYHRWNPVFPRTRVYLFATRSTFDPLKRDLYDMKKQRLASTTDLRDSRIDCSRWIFRATRYRRSGGFHTNPTMGTATAGIRLSYDSAK